MRHFMSKVNDTTAAVISNRRNGNIVADLATRGLCALRNARSLLVRLTGRASALLQVGMVRHMQLAVGVAGAARPLRHYRLSKLWSRPSRRPPGRGAASKRF